MLSPPPYPAASLLPLSTPSSACSPSPTPVSLSCTAPSLSSAPVASSHVPSPSLHPSPVTPCAAFASPHRRIFAAHRSLVRGSLAPKEQ